MHYSLIITNKSKILLGTFWASTNNYTVQFNILVEVHGHSWLATTIVTSWDIYRPDGNSFQGVGDFRLNLCWNFYLLNLDLPWQRYKDSWLFHWSVAVACRGRCSKEPSLEDKIQNSLRENLKEIGHRCIQEMREFIDRLKEEDIDDV